MRVRQWLAGVLPPGERVVAVQAMPGATSSDVHAVATETASGARRQLVLRRYVNRAWLAREPDLAEHEARVLSLRLEGKLTAPVEVVGIEYDAYTAGEAPPT